MSGKNIDYEGKKIELLKPQWLKDLARDNLMFMVVYGCMDVYGYFIMKNINKNTDSN